jgi:hypothetical protein
MSLADPMNLRTWQYVVRFGANHRGHAYTMNENLTGAVVGDQRPLRTTFKAALAIIAMWNANNTWSKNPYRLLIPNEAT